MPKGHSMPSGYRRRVFDRDGWRCLCCGDNKDLTLDHIDPFGPPYAMSNLQTLCWPCNRSKSSRVRSYLHNMPKFPYARRI